jgi:hypothetical protein
VIPANIQDRDCAANLIRKTRHLLGSPKSSPTAATLERNSKQRLRANRSSWKSSSAPTTRAASRSYAGDG